MIKSYSQAADYTFKQARFNHQGKEYSSRGFMTWSAEKGFRIELLLNEKFTLSQEPTVIKPVDIIHQRDRCLVRMQLGGQVNAYTEFYLGNDLGLLIDNRTSVSVRKVTFYKRLPDIGKSSPKTWDAYTFLRTRERIHLPDNIYAETSINDRVVHKNYGIGGIDYRDEKIQLVGRMLDEQHLEIHWSLSKKHFDRNTSKRWPEALQHALSILTFEVIQPLRRVVTLGSKSREEIFKQEDAEFISLKGGARTSLTHKEIIGLASFLASDSPHVRTCRHIFDQIVEADRQKSWTATELLISTVLEAALRTIYNYPFVPNTHTPFPRRECMTRFRDDFWTPAAEKYCVKALDIFKKFRHRNAHPEWLTAAQGGRSDEEQAQSLEDMRFLCWFYRYMILGLAGFRDIAPLFPDF